MESHIIFIFLLMRAWLLQGQASTDHLYFCVYLSFHVLQTHSGHSGSLLSSFRGLSRRCSLLFITCTGGWRERGGEWMGLWWLKLDKGLGNTPKTLLAVCVWGVHAAARRLAALTLTLTRSHAHNTHAHTHTGMQARTHTHTVW